VRGLKYYLAEQPHDQYRSSGYLLVREPTNEHDKDAIAVYERGVKIGFVAASRAGFTAALLDELNAPAYRIEGRPDGYGRVLIEMPTVPALRELVTARPRPA
jgi:Cys-tRNA synthase (O-phospho-L-seryl-tRNA:Cys-tRNA synthase)